MLTTKQVARRIGISLPYMYDLIHQDKIKYKKLGASYIFEPQDIETFIKHWRKGMDQHHTVPQYSPTECRYILRSEGFYNNRDRGKKRGWWFEDEFFGLSAQEAFLNWTLANATKDCHTMTQLNYLEKRKYYRKKTSFSGEFINTKNNPKNVIVVDISRSGAKIEIARTASESFGTQEKGTLVFHLDDQAESIIEKEAMIRSISNKEGICEFTTFTPYDRLTRYLAGTNFSTGRTPHSAVTLQNATDYMEEENFISDITEVFEELLKKE